MTPRTWRRTPFGYLSTDGRYFLERGGMMTHGCNAWLVWERVEETFGPEDVRPSAYRKLSEISGLVVDQEADAVFLDCEVEGGWLSEAKDIVERMRANSQRVEDRVGTEVEPT